MTEYGRITDAFSSTPTEPKSVLTAKKQLKTKTFTTSNQPKSITALWHAFWKVSGKEGNTLLWPLHSNTGKGREGDKILRILINSEWHRKQLCEEVSKYLSKGQETPQQRQEGNPEQAISQLLCWVTGKKLEGWVCPDLAGVLWCKTFNWLLKRGPCVWPPAMAGVVVLPLLCGRTLHGKLTSNSNWEGERQLVPYKVSGVSQLHQLVSKHTAALDRDAPVKEEQGEGKCHDN